MNSVCVGVAGNIEPERHIPATIETLSQMFPGLEEAPTYQTAPIGRPEQGDYWNTAVRFSTGLDVEALRQRLRLLEAEAGRVRTNDAYAARELDLDILWWNRRPPDAETAAETKRRPWNQWCLHRLGVGPAPVTPEPAVV